MRNSPYEPYALRQAVSEVDKKLESLRKSIEENNSKSKKKGILSRLLRWFTR